MTSYDFSNRGGHILMGSGTYTSRMYNNIFNDTIRIRVE